jgi:hypothetical protein
MSKFWYKVVRFVKRLDTKDARMSVAEDLKKASFTLFGLFMLSVPGTYAAILQAAAALLGVPPQSLKVSTATLAFLVLGSFILRAVAFVLECDIRADTKKKKTGKAKRK